MRITNNGSNPLSNPAAQDARSSETSRAYSSGRADGARRPERAESTSSESAIKPDISARAREFSKAKEIATGAPDVREEKIAELKRRIAEGKYSVDGDKVADRMVNDHMHMGIG
jgi:negative regulator of flagellin synthesis FlgM